MSSQVAERLSNLSQFLSVNSGDTTIMKDSNWSIVSHHDCRAIATSLVYGYPSTMLRSVIFNKCIRTDIIIDNRRHSLFSDTELNDLGKTTENMGPLRMKVKWDDNAPIVHNSMPSIGSDLSLQALTGVTPEFLEFAMNKLKLQVNDLEIHDISHSITGSREIMASSTQSRSTISGFLSFVDTKAPSFKIDANTML
jgi:hypothetical protein